MDSVKSPLVAVIREAECIGCTHCIQACPADAILGSAKWMHTVIADECIGCKLCVAPCPVDCIDMVPRTGPIQDKITRKQKADHFRSRYKARQKRLLHEEPEQQGDALGDKKAYIQAALERARLKKKTD
jgi:electron transport complex protein RnfB